MEKVTYKVSKEHLEAITKVLCNEIEIACVYFKPVTLPAKISMMIMEDIKQELIAKNFKDKETHTIKWDSVKACTFFICVNPILPRLDAYSQAVLQKLNNYIHQTVIIHLP